MTKPRHFPAVEPGEYVVGFAQQTTGHILRTDLRLALPDDIDRYVVHKSRQDAEQFCQEMVRLHPEIECFVMDDTGMEVCVISNV